MSLGSSHVKLPIHPNMNGLDNAVIMEVLSWKRKFFFFFLYIIYNLHFFEQKTYIHQVLIYLNVPGISVRKPLQNRQIVS